MVLHTCAFLFLPLLLDVRCGSADAHGNGEQEYQEFRKQIKPNLENNAETGYNNNGRRAHGNRVYLKASIFRRGNGGEGPILGEFGIDGEIVPSNVVVNCLKPVSCCAWKGEQSSLPKKAYSVVPVKLMVLQFGYDSGQ